MRTTLCIADHCGTPNQHGEHCPGDACRGCLPRRAADGLRLCDVDTRRLAEDARTAAVLYEDMGLTLIRSQNGAQRIGAGHSSSGAPVPDDDGMEARTAIRVTLVGLCRLIHDERGFTLPADDVPAMGLYVANNATWLAAHPAADEHAKDLRDIASDRRNWSLAYPSGSDRLYIGDCPLEVTAITAEPYSPLVKEVCGTRLYAWGDQPLIQCQGCGTEETIEWWQRQIVGEATRLVDAYAGAADLAMRHRRPVDPALIRKWAQLGKVARRGQDERRRTLYDVDELRRYAEQLWRSVAA